MKKITITVFADEATPKVIVNAVRRSFEKVTEFENDKGTVKGVGFKIREQKSAPKADTFAAEVREWARENGKTVGTRGRVSQELVAEFIGA